MRTESLPLPPDPVDPSTGWAHRLTRLAALADAVVEKLHATAEHENLSPDSPVEFGIELGEVLKTEIAALRREAALQETARLIGRIAA